MLRLFVAVECGDVKKVDELLARLPQQQRQQAERKLVDYRHRTAMHLAVEHGHEDVVEMLLGHSSGIDLSIKDYAGFTALHLACELGHDKLVGRLLKGKTAALALERTSNDEEMTCMHLAAIRGHVSIVKALLATNPVLAIMEDKRKRSPLHFAVEYGHTEIAGLLVESARSQVVAGDEAMFHAAIRAGHDNIVSQLLDHRPQLIDVVDSDGLTPLHLAAKCGHDSIVEQLFARRQPRLAEVGGIYHMTLLHFAAQYGCDTIVAELLVEKPHLVDAIGDYDRTVLHFAAQNGHDRIVEQLLVHKPTLIDAKDVDDMLPLHLAAIEGHEKVVEQLVARRPDLVDVGDKRGDSALSWACYKTHPKVVASLLAHGAVASKGMLWDAFKYGVNDSRISEVMKLIYAHNSNLMRSDEDEDAAVTLHDVFGIGGQSFFSGELMTTVWQVSSSHALHETDHDNDTPLHLAIQFDNDFAIGLMMQKLSLEEILEGFAKFNRNPLPFLDIREPLLLGRDAAATVWEYLGFKQRRNKKMRGESKEE